MINRTLFPPKFFVTGTDTNVGKTLVCALLMQALGYSYWKPIQSGSSDRDLDWIKKTTGLPTNQFNDEAYLLKEPLSPHTSAELEGITIDLANIILPNSSKLIIEGAGGIMVPLNDKHLLIDLIKQLNIPTLIVARSGLGTLNHTLLTIDKLRSYNIPIIGVILNGNINEKNAQTIEKFGNVPIVGQVVPLKQINSQSLYEAFENL